MRFVLLLVLLSGCAHRFLRVTAAPMLNCPQDELKIRERPEDPIWYRVSGCGRLVYCQQQIWSGPDEWRCQSEDPAPPK